MLFRSKGSSASEKILYQTRPNMVVACKKVIYASILIAILIFIAPIIVGFISEMQVYLISYVKLSLTKYTAIALFVLILIIVLYMIWQLIGWYATEYTLTDSRIIIKSGVLRTKKSYMPYATIQDVNTSQSILDRIINVGTISLYSAYDNSQLELANVSNPSEIENIIFSNIRIPPQQSYIPSEKNFLRPKEERYEEDYYSDDDYITPIHNEREEFYQKALNDDYEYYPEDLNYNQPKRYEYEDLDDLVDKGIRYEGAPNYYPKQQQYSPKLNERENYTDKNQEEVSQIVDESSEGAIKRHFDKFKK